MWAKSSRVAMTNPRCGTTESLKPAIGVTPDLLDDSRVPATALSCSSPTTIRGITPSSRTGSSELFEAAHTCAAAEATAIFGGGGTACNEEHARGVDNGRHRGHRQGSQPAP